MVPSVSGDVLCTIYAQLKYIDVALLRQMLFIHFLESSWDKTRFMEAILQMGQSKRGSLKRITRDI